MAKGEILGHQISSVAEEADNKWDDQRQLERHDGDVSLGFAEAGNEELHPRTY